MIRLALVLLLASSASSALADVNVWRDGQNNVIEMSSSNTPITTGLVLVAGALSVPTEATAPGSLTDSHGRFVWRVSGRTVVSGSPRWPSNATLKRAATARLRARIDESLAAILALERWQADPQNVAVADRAAELTAAQTRLGQLRDVLAGD